MLFGFDAGLLSQDRVAVVGQRLKEAKEERAKAVEDELYSMEKAIGALLEDVRQQARKILEEMEK